MSTLHRLSYYFFFSSRRRHTRSKRDWSSDVCSSDLPPRNGNDSLPSNARTMLSTCARCCIPPILRTFCLSSFIRRFRAILSSLERWLFVSISAVRRLRVDCISRSPAQRPSPSLRNGRLSPRHAERSWAIDACAPTLQHARNGQEEAYPKLLLIPSNPTSQSSCFLAKQMGRLHRGSQKRR